MNNLLYARLAKTNLSKNRQNILPYLLSCIGTVVMLPVYITLRGMDLEFLAQFGAELDLTEAFAP